MPHPNNKLLCGICLVGVAITAAAPASAQIKVPSCTVSATSVAFGTYNGRSGVSLDGVGTVSVNCSNYFGSGATLAIGTGGSGSYASRRVAAGANSILYNLYTSTARTTVWGDGTSGTATVPAASATTYTVYGRIPANQKVPVGSYSDVVVVTLVY